MLQQNKEPGGTIQQSRVCLKVLLIAACWYGVGKLFFLTKACFDVDTSWDKAYYVWRAASDFLLFLALFCVYKKYRLYIGLILLITTIQLCVEITTIFTTMAANNPAMVFILWVTLTGSITFLSIREIILRIKKVIAEWELK